MAELHQRTQVKHKFGNSNKRLLIFLIDKLGLVEQQLQKLCNEISFSGNYVLAQERYKNFNCLINCLDSLVIKTIEGKGEEDDITTQQYTKLDVNDYKSELIKHNSLSSVNAKEFLEETHSLMNICNKPKIFSTQLLTFQELLGDIIFSACQLNSYKIVAPSGILVKDLVHLKNKCVAIWRILCSFFGTKSKDKCENPSCSYKKQKLADSDEFVDSNRAFVEIKYSLQSCLGEMSKVKLEIEQYFQINVIEQYSKEPATKLDNQTGETKRKPNSYLESERSVYNSDAFHEDSYFSSFDNFQQNLGKESSEQRVFCGMQDFLNPNLLPEYNQVEENLLNSILFSSVFEKAQSSNEWGEVRHRVDTRSDFYNGPIIYDSADLFMLDSPTVFIQSTIPPQHKSLPKIYSIHSVDKVNSQNHTNVTGMPQNDSSHVSLTSSGIKHESQTDYSAATTSTNESTLENGFCANPKSTEDIGPTISKVLTDIFNSDTLNQRKVGSKYYSNINDLNSVNTFDTEDSFHTENKIKDEQTFNFVNSDAYRKFKSECITTKDKLSNTTDEHHSVKKQMNNTDKSQNAKDCGCQIAESVEKLDKYCQTACFSNKNTSTKTLETMNQQHVVLDPPTDHESLVEIFRIERPKHISEETCNQNQKYEDLWPVKGKYIHVSKSKQKVPVAQKTSHNGVREKQIHSLPSSNTFSSTFSLNPDKNIQENQNSEEETLSPVNSLQLIQRKNQVNNVLFKESNILFDNGPIKAQNETSFIKQFTFEQKGCKKICQTMAVQYAECDDSFRVINKNYDTNANFDFLKLNNKRKNNWNSIISIFASNVTLNRHINPHKLFKKIIYNMGPDTPKKYNHIHTLTSNGSPYRLFDINGYPLTDSSGNVLKDPYGKTLVHLDATGFPKDGAKIFDALGNSSKDMNFDPTQKPKSKSIGMKLTDKSKKPLHLFDKYGRSLTDSVGKLLVNIHGRPLLRFDNFGRPSTDYRGGPLYTDNGYEWSYEPGHVISNEKYGSPPRGNMLMGKGDNEYSESEITEYSNIETSSHMIPLDKRKVTKKLNEHSANDNRLLNMLLSDSDIWSKVENVLQQLPKKNNEPIINKNTVDLKLNNLFNCQRTKEKELIDKELMKSIIYFNIPSDEDVMSKAAYGNISNLSELKYSPGLLPPLPQSYNQTMNAGCQVITNSNLVTDIDVGKNSISNSNFDKQILIKNICTQCGSPDQKLNERTEFIINNKSEQNPTNITHPLLEKHLLPNKSVRQFANDTCPSLPSNSVQQMRNNDILDRYENLFKGFPCYKTIPQKKKICHSILTEKTSQTLNTKSNCGNILSFLSVKNKEHYSTNTLMSEYTNSGISKLTPFTKYIDISTIGSRSSTQYEQTKSSMNGIGNSRSEFLSYDSENTEKKVFDNPCLRKTIQSKQTNDLQIQKIKRVHSVGNYSITSSYDSHHCYRKSFMAQISDNIKIDGNHSPKQSTQIQNVLPTNPMYVNNNFDKPQKNTNTTGVTLVQKRKNINRFMLQREITKNRPTYVGPEEQLIQRNIKYSKIKTHRKICLDTNKPLKQIDEQTAEDSYESEQEQHLKVYDNPSNLTKSTSDFVNNDSLCEVNKKQLIQPDHKYNLPPPYKPDEGNESKCADDPRNYLFEGQEMEQGEEIGNSMDTLKDTTNTFQSKLEDQIEQSGPTEYDAYPKIKKKFFDVFQYKQVGDIQKNIHNDRKIINPIKKPQTTGNKECRFVSFLGDPVKYVLNKLDTKRSSKQDDAHNLKVSSKTLKHKTIQRNLVIESKVERVTKDFNRKPVNDVYKSKYVPGKKALERDESHRSNKLPISKPFFRWKSDGKSRSVLDSDSCTYLAHPIKYQPAYGQLSRHNRNSMQQESQRHGMIPGHKNHIFNKSKNVPVHHNFHRSSSVSKVQLPITAVRQPLQQKFKYNFLPSLTSSKKPEINQSARTSHLKKEPKIPVPKQQKVMNVLKKQQGSSQNQKRDIYFNKNVNYDNVASSKKKLFVLNKLNEHKHTARSVSPPSPTPKILYSSYRQTK